MCYNLLGDLMKRFVSILTIFIAVAITIYYLHFAGIFGNSSALSTVGLSHPIWFALWGASTYFALYFNIHIAFSKTKYKFYILLMIISLIGMILTISCDFDYSNYNEYLAHCIGSLTFSSVTGVTIFCLFIVLKKYSYAIICAIVLITDLILLLIFKETALIETIPIFIGYILLTINNLEKEKEAIEIK